MADLYTSYTRREVNKTTAITSCLNYVTNTIELLEQPNTSYFDNDQLHEALISAFNDIDFYSTVLDDDDNN